MAKYKKAFTLIELLVVIAIISLLVSILLPSLNRAKDLARGVVCMSNLKGLLLQNQFYTNDNEGAFPKCNPLPFWFDLYREYGENVGLVNCPSSSHLIPFEINPTFLSADAPDYVVSIGYNAWIAINYVSAAWNISDLKSADKTVLFSDAYGRSEGELKGSAYIQFMDWNVWSLIEKRHNSMTTANAGYTDGHVGYVDDGIAEYNSDEASRLFWLGK